VNNASRRNSSGQNKDSETEMFRAFDKNAPREMTSLKSPKNPSGKKVKETT
jgi:hypothetical protein